MSDPDLILTLIAKTVLAEEQLIQDHNYFRLVLPPQNSFVFSRDTTPLLEGDEPFDQSRPYIELRFSQPPLDQAYGFMLGSDPKVCDVVIGKLRDSVSRTHLIVSFRQDGALLLEDSKEGNATEIERSDIFTPAVKQRVRTVLIPGQSLTVRVSRSVALCFRIPQREDDDEKYRSNIRQWHQDVIDSAPAINPLQLNSVEKTAQISGTLSPLHGHDNAHLIVRAVLSHRGRYSTVVDALEQPSLRRVVVKAFRMDPRIHYTRTSYRECLSKWNAEVKYTSACNHPNLVEVLSTSLDRSEMKLPYYEHGNMADLERLPRRELYSVSIQLLSGIEWLHSRNTGHGDISPINVYIETRNPLKVRLGDLGEAFDASSLQRGSRGNRKYWAPEMWEEAFQYGRKSDVWSVAVLLLEAWCSDLNTENFDESSTGSCRDYFRSIISFAKIHSGKDPFVAILSNRMLQYFKGERDMATGCLAALRKAGHQLKTTIFNSSEAYPPSIRSPLPKTITYNSEKQEETEEEDEWGEEDSATPRQSSPDWV